MAQDIRNSPRLEKLAYFSCSRIHLGLQEALLELLEKHGPKGGTLLDIGCWDGVHTMKYAGVVQAVRVLGLEGFPEQAALAQKNGVDVHLGNIELIPFPLATASVDVAVCNQVFEHLKDVFKPMDEIARTMKPGGIFLFSVPNLASLHNRLLLLLGMQPTCIRVFGPHVRSFTLKEFIIFSVAGGLFELVEVRGVGFYPFPPKFLGNVFSNLWKSACHTPILVLRRTAATEFSYVQEYARQGEQTLI
ncbi:MAG: class I SAM-dependent methyltransferase [Chthoniobacterales bacterium]